MDMRNSAALGQPADRLGGLGAVARRLGIEALAREAVDIAVRVEEGRFFVACVGQFKRGKSTLLNALIGEPILPTGVVPVTSAITLLRSGPRGARVRFEDGREESVPVESLPEFVTEEGNPENRKHVRAVEVSVPCSILGRGMCLVDTPGLGSSFSGNAAVTREFVPHIDAALVVVGADPPLSGDEVALVEDVARHARHVLVVLNKADRVTEREREEGARFAAQVLAARLLRPIGPIFQVSAHERITTGVATRDWDRLVKGLESLAAARRPELVEAAEARGVERLGRALVAEIDERCAALARPIEESEQRVATLTKHVAAAEHAMQDLGVLLAAEQAKLSSEFRERQERFLAPAQEAAAAELCERISALQAPKHRLRGAGFEVARDIAQTVSALFRSEVEPEAERLYRQAMERFVALANEFVGRVAREPGMAGIEPVGPEAGFRVRGELRYTDLLSTTTSTPLDWAADLLRPRSLLVRFVQRRSGDYLDRLIEANSSRVANDLVERAAASRARLESELRSRIREVSERAVRALADARERMRDGQPAVAAELSRLDALRRETESLIAARSRRESS